MAVHVIKKYANRKLYDLSTRRYVTLDTVAALVGGGEEVQVLDQESGADITSEIVGQATDRGPRSAGASRRRTRTAPARTAPARRAPAPRAPRVTAVDLEEESGRGPAEMLLQLVRSSLVLPLELGQRAAVGLEAVVGGRGATVSQDADIEELAEVVTALAAEVAGLREELAELREAVAVQRLEDRIS